MSKFAVAEALLSEDKISLADNIKKLLIENGINNFTIFEVNGVVCAPIVSNNGISGDMIMDIYDLGYPNKLNISNVQYIDKIYPVSHIFYSEKQDSLFYIFIFHSPLKNEHLDFIEKITALAAQRASQLSSYGQMFDMMVDYQTKLDLVISSNEIFRGHTLDDVIVNAVEYLFKIFSPNVCCAVNDNYFMGIGIERYELEEIQKDFNPLIEFIKANKTPTFLDSGVYSDKFLIDNVYFFHEQISDLYFIMFNLNEYSFNIGFASLVENVLSSALENAKEHEKYTSFMIAKAEMNQTTEILKEFMVRECSADSPCLYGANYPAESASGDFCTVKDMGDKIFFAVADVCGKGYAAAVFTVMLSSITNIADITNMQNYVNSINNYMLSREFKERFITAFFCIYDKTNGIMNYINCGHEPAMLLHDGKINRLMSELLPLGVIDENYSSSQIKVYPGDMLFIYTDGVIEYIDYDVLEEVLADKSNLSPKEIVTSLYEDLVINQLSQKDDFTCISVKF